MYFEFISFAVSAIADTVVSKSTLRFTGISLLAIMKPTHDLTAPYAQRSMHGICTKPATGSQVRPRWCSSADSAELAMTSWSRSCAWAMSAAPIAEATPISAWQPPSAPASVALCLQR